MDWRRWIACAILALAAIAVTQVWGADYDFSDRKPVPRPSEVSGWALFRVCSVTGKLDHRFSEYAYIRPHFIIGIGNPPTSPDPCVALHGLSGRRIFVEGAMTATARYLEDVTEEIAQ